MQTCDDSGKSWVIEVKFPTKHPIWCGNVWAECRNDAKREAQLFLSRHFPLDAKILRIARGYLGLTFYEEPEDFSRL